MADRALPEQTGLIPRSMFHESPLKDINVKDPAVQQQFTEIFTITLPFAELFRSKWQTFCGNSSIPGLVLLIELSSTPSPFSSPHHVNKAEHLVNQVRCFGVVMPLQLKPPPPVES